MIRLAERLTGNPGPLEGTRVVGLAMFDSFAKTAMHLLRVCRMAGASTELHLLEPRSRPLSRRQWLEICRVDRQTPIERRIGSQLGAPLASLGQVDVLVALLDGRRSRLLGMELERLRMRPLVVSAYPGILFRHQLEGMMDRSYADLLCLNTDQDALLYQQGCGAIGIDAANACVTGLPILWDLKPRNRQPEPADPVVFFEQPSVPANPLQRSFIADQLAALARRHPDVPILLKPRTSALEATLHRRHGELERLVRRHGERLENLRVSHKSARVLLHRCQCAITVSSTVALEAMALSVSTRLVSDLGINETLGNHYFLESGALATFASIETDFTSLVHRSGWLSREAGEGEGAQRFLTALIELLRHRQESGTPSAPAHPPRRGGWGSELWQHYARTHGGRRMLASAGVDSISHPKQRTKNVLRWLRQTLLGWVPRRWRPHQRQ